MSKDLTFKAREAGEISGVTPLTQRDWRRRGFLPDFEGERARFTLREVAQFRILREFAQAGFSLKDAAECADLLASPFPSVLGEAVFARLRDLPSHQRLIGVVVSANGQRRLMIVPDHATADRELGEDRGAVTVIMDLGKMATDMADTIKRIEVAPADRRIDALNEEAEKHGA